MAPAMEPAFTLPGSWTGVTAAAWSASGASIALVHHVEEATVLEDGVDVVEPTWPHRAIGAGLRRPNNVKLWLMAMDTFEWLTHGHGDGRRRVTLRSHHAQRL